MRLKTSLALLLLGGMTVTSVLDQDAARLNQRALAATCANCHGTDGRTVQGSAIPSLAGMPKDYMVQQMKAFQNGTRPATVMHQLAKGLTDAQIESAAAYFSTLKR